MPWRMRVGLGGQPGTATSTGMTFDTRPQAGVALSEDTAGAAAVAERDHELGVGCGVVRSAQGHLHVFRDGAGDQQQIGVPGARDEADAEPFEVVEGIVERVDLELAAVAGAGVDVTDAERTAEHGTNAILQVVANAQALIRLRRLFGDDSDRCNLAQRFQHSGELQIMAAVGEIEGLIDEREIRDDVADDGVLEHGPVLPRRIVRVTAADRARCSRFERDEHRTAPAFDQSCSHGPIGGHAHWGKVRPSRERVENAPDETTGFLQLIEAHGDARGYIPLASSDHRRRELRVRLARQVDAQIERLARSRDRRAR